jgi:hypothetical protein
MKPHTLFTANIVLLSLFIIALWAVDIGVSGMVFQAQYFGSESYAVGLFGERSAMDQYHVGLLLAIFSMMLMVIINTGAMLEPEPAPKRKKR